ncbi:hypothetical protein B0H12DRAFT_1075378 [Mycena haematopus]|nr:hypothetical protein B0H12DRAFT_1075378 [Mycena haematopus]
MCDVYSTSIVVGTISLIPYNRYIFWSFSSASLLLYTADRQRPSNKFGLLQTSIDSVGETLELASATSGCARNFVELMDVTSRFHDVSTWDEFVEGLRNFKEIWQSINQCSKKVEEIRISVECIIEAEHQRELSKDIQESRATISSLRRRIRSMNFQSAAGSM